MADFVLAPSPPADPTACLPLGPPLWTAEVESNGAKAANDAASSNPTFELVYWRFGLSLAARWRARLGLPPVRVRVNVRARARATARPNPNPYPNPNPGQARAPPRCCLGGSAEAAMHPDAATAG